MDNQNTTPIETTVANTPVIQPQQQPHQTIPNQKTGMSNTIKAIIGCLGCGLLIGCLVGTGLFINSMNKTSKNDDDNKTEITPTPVEDNENTDTDTNTDSDPTPTKAKSTPTSAPTTSATNAPGADDYGEDVTLTTDTKLPVSKKFVEEMATKTQVMSTLKNYGRLIAPIGIPTYNFGMLYNLDWEKDRNDAAAYTLKSKAGDVEAGVLYYSAGTAEYKAKTCEALVKLIFAGADITIDKKEPGLSINGRTWDRVYYTVTSEGNIFRGIDQCLVTEDMLMNNFILATDAIWDANAESMFKSMEDIYVYKVKE